MSFAAAWATARTIEGWLTEAQARRLHDAAARLGPGAAIVEIGAFRGRSTVVLAQAAPAGVAVVTIDPHLGSDRGPQQIAERPQQGAADLRALRANLDRAGVAQRVRHVRRRSAEALDDVVGPVALLFVDGAHRPGLAREDLLRWGARVPPGGRMLVHDAFSSVGVTLALGTVTVAGGRWRYLGRTGSLADFAREDLTAAQRSANAGRQVAQLGWFAANLARKALILAGVRRGPWPH